MTQRMNNYLPDLVKLDYLGDLGMSEMIGLMRLHVQEVTRFTTLVSHRITLPEHMVLEFRSDLESEGVDPDPFLCFRPGCNLTFSPEGVFLLKICAKIHDIGKPFFRGIYSQRRKLTQEEYQRQKLHANFSRIIVRSWACNPDHEFDYPELVRLVGKMGADHQEKFNGSGYPDGHSGADITLVGRLLAITDAISAMANPRPYQGATPLNICLDNLRKSAGSHFDPELVERITMNLENESRTSERISGEWVELDGFSDDYYQFIQNIVLDDSVLLRGDREKLEDLQAEIRRAL